MHVLPDSFDMLSSNCLDEKPWHKFPFTGFVAMLSAIVTLMVDSMATSIYSRRSKAGVNPDSGGVAAIEGDQEMAVADGGHGHFHSHHHQVKGGSESQLTRYRVVAMVSCTLV
jgi:zinc transporter 1/2/3